MTTRRRRTASETGCDEPPLTGRTASILPVSQAEAYNPLTCNLQPPGNLSWNSPIQTDAVYKKTDVAANSPGFQNRGFQPQQIINYPTNFNNTRTTNNSFNSNYSSPYSVQPSVNLDYAPPPTNSFSHSSFGSSNDNNPFWVSDVKEIENMASRDRTQEFARIIRSQQGNLVNGAFPYKEGRKPKDYRQYAEFMQRAKLIGRNISSTYAKLEKLTHLAKKRSLFDDSQDQEIQELTGIIRHDLTSLTKQLEELQNRSRLSNSQLNGSSGQLQKHSANLVGSLQTKVASITQKFRDVLEVRTESLKKQAERREQYAGGGISGELPPQAVAGHHQGSVLMKEEAAAAAATRNRPPSLGRAGDFSIDMGSDAGGGGGSGSLEGAVGGGGTTAYQQQLVLVEEQDAYLQSRADTMKTIESTIVELGQMFSQLATMVKEQEEIVHRIDSNVDDAEMNVEAAHTELLKYFKSVSSNRWLMLKVFGVLIFFFVVFVVFMA